LPVVIERLNLFLWGRGNFSRTGNAGRRNLRAGQVISWTGTRFHDQGLHQLMGTIRYPKAA
jgi:hypothetical protein